MSELALILLLAFLCGPAHAQPARASAIPMFEQRPGAHLPLDAAFVDDAGRSVRLGRFFNDAPVLLVLGYYRCPDLCSTVMDGVLQTVAALGLPPGGYRVLGVSIDPREDAATAARKKQAYAPLLAGGTIRFDLLTGATPAIDRLAQATGFHYAWDAAHQRYLHPAGFLVASGDGVITRYFPGAGFATRDLRLALLEASRGQVGSVTDRIALMCSHFDPATGRYTGMAWNLVRAAGLLAAALLAALCWRLRRRARRPA